MLYTETIGHDLTEEETEKLIPEYEQKHLEIRNTAVTLLVIALLIPEALVFLSHLLKSIFGSQPWPTMRIILMVCCASVIGLYNPTIR